MARKVPRKFSLHFGSGEVIEEAAFTGEHHEPTIQLLEFTDGDAAGALMLRFCSYNLRGQFQRDPLMVSEELIEPLRDALRDTPKLRELLRRLIE